MSSRSDPEAADGRTLALKAIAHDLGNLAYRLTFLRASLARHVPDAAARSDAEELLEDTIAGLQALTGRIRGICRDV